MKNICIVVGARPNFIKVAPIIHAVQRMRQQGREVDYSLVYAGTETDATLEPTLFGDLQIPRPDVFLGVDCDSLNELVGKGNICSHINRALERAKEIINK